MSSRKKIRAKSDKKRRVSRLARRFGRKVTPSERRSA